MSLQRFNFRNHRGQSQSLYQSASIRLLVAHLYTTLEAGHPPSSSLTDKRKTRSPVTHSLLHLSLPTPQEKFVSVFSTTHITYTVQPSNSNRPFPHALTSKSLLLAVTRRSSTSTDGPALCSKEEKSLCPIPRLAALHRPSFGLRSSPPGQKVQTTHTTPHTLCAVVDVDDSEPRIAASSFTTSTQVFSGETEGADWALVSSLATVAQPATAPHSSIAF